MERQELIDALKRVAPAVGDKDFLEVLVCFCFAPGMVFAYDDAIAISTPIKDFPISGAIRKDAILPWLSQARGRDLTYEFTDPTFKLACGHSRTEMTVVNASEFVFNPPNLKKGTEIKISAAFTAAIRRGLVAMQKDADKGWQSGITLRFHETGLDFYSTNEVAAARTSLRYKKPLLPEPRSLLLPPRFCVAFADLAKDSDPKRIVLGDRWIAACFADGTRLFGKYGAGASVKTYRKLFDEADKALPKFVPIPNGFEKSLARCAIPLAHVEDGLVEIKMLPGKMIIKAASRISSVTERLQTKLKVTSTEELWPDALRAVLPHVARFGVTPGRHFAFAADEFLYLVSVASEAE